MVKKAKLYKDILGQIDTDVYFRESEVPKLISFLESLGYEVEPIQMHPSSENRHKPFIDDKPRVQKLITHEIDWYNPEIIEFILNNASKGSDFILKEVVKKSGLVDEKESKATELAVNLRFQPIFHEYEKWKNENKLSEDSKSKPQLHKEFSRYYADLIEKSHQKRVQPGTKVYIKSKNTNGIIKSFDDKKGYDVEFEVNGEEGYSGWFERRDLEKID